MLRPVVVEPARDDVFLTLAFFVVGEERAALFAEDAVFFAAVCFFAAF